MLHRASYLNQKYSRDYSRDYRRNTYYKRIPFENRQKKRKNSHPITDPIKNSHISNEEIDNISEQTDSGG